MLIIIEEDKALRYNRTISCVALGNICCPTLHGGETD